MSAIRASRWVEHGSEGLAHSALLPTGRHSRRRCLAKESTDHRCPQTRCRRSASKPDHGLSRQPRMNVQRLWSTCGRVSRWRLPPLVWRAMDFVVDPSGWYVRRSLQHVVAAPARPGADTSQGCATSQRDEAQGSRLRCAARRPKVTQPGGGRFSPWWFVEDDSNADPGSEHHNRVLLTSQYTGTVDEWPELSLGGESGGWVCRRGSCCGGGSSVVCFGRGMATGATEKGSGRCVSAGSVACGRCSVGVSRMVSDGGR